MPGHEVRRRDSVKLAFLGANHAVGVLTLPLNGSLKALRADVLSIAVHNLLICHAHILVVDIIRARALSRLDVGWEIIPSR